jgi:hypothetical protein
LARRTPSRIIVLALRHAANRWRTAGMATKIPLFRTKERTAFEHDGPPVSAACAHLKPLIDVADKSPPTHYCSVNP